MRWRNTRHIPPRPTSQRSCRDRDYLRGIEVNGAIDDAHRYGRSARFDGSASAWYTNCDTKGSVSCQKTRSDHTEEEARSKVSSRPPYITSLINVPVFDRVIVPISASAKSLRGFHKYFAYSILASRIYPHHGIEVSFSVVHLCTFFSPSCHPHPSRHRLCSYHDCGFCSDSGCDSSPSHLSYHLPLDSCPASAEVARTHSQPELFAPRTCCHPVL